ncbi:hypothetical protein B0H14DRAFT_2279671, partial [Mycena olivaceomarginata]
GGDFRFSCRGPEGEILALPHGAIQQKLQNLTSLREYVLAHAASWYEYICGSMGRELANGDLYLITGHEKAPSWGMASYHAHATNDKEFMLTFQTDTPHQYRWVSVPGQINPSQLQRKCYNQPPSNDPLNHTVFLHGWSISLGTGLWSRLFGVTVQTSSIADFKSRVDRFG